MRFPSLAVLYKLMTKLAKSGLIIISDGNPAIIFQQIKRILTYRTARR